MSALSSQPRAPLGPDVTGWLLDEARPALIGHELTLVETMPPRAAGPLGDWRVLRCLYQHGSENNCELLIAREQLPKLEHSDSSDP